MIYRYTHQSKSSRELFLYEDIVNRIKYGIKNKRVLKLTFDDERKTSILPFYIGSSKLELGNYIFCYDFLEMRYKNYKLSNIKTIFITQEEKEWENKDFIENVIKNFDPFLSQGKKIKVSLTEEGQNFSLPLHSTVQRLSLKMEISMNLGVLKSKLKDILHIF